jgi:hypothetical protein
MKRLLIGIALVFVVSAGVYGQSLFPPNGILGLIAGSNIVVSGSSSTPTVAVTAAPSFTKITSGQGCVGTVCATGIGADDLSVANGTGAKIWLGSAGTNYLALSGSTLDIGGGNLSMLSGNSVTSGNSSFSGSGITSGGTLNVNAPGSVSVNYTAGTAGTILETYTVATSATPTPGPNTYTLLKFANSTYPGQIPKLGAGVADPDDGLGTHGGYFIISSTSFAVTPISIEAIIATPGGHVGMPQNVLQASVTSPTTCAALTCGATYTETFTYPYVTNAGAAQNPVCVNPGIEDATSPSTIWVGNVVAGSESSTSVQYNYSPVVATVAAHSLTFTMTCYQGVF